MAVTLGPGGVIYSDGTVQTAAPTDTGDLISITSFTSTGTYTVPAGCSMLYVKVQGGGGGAAGYCESGGAGGYAEAYISVPANSLTPGVSTITATVGAGGGAVGYYAAAGNGGTSSFGSYVSATGGYGSNNNYSHTGGHGGYGSGGLLQLAGGGGTGHANHHSHGAVARGGDSYYGNSAGANRGLNTGKAGQGAPGTGGPGARTDDGSVGGTGESGMVVVYAYK